MVISKNDRRIGNKLIAEFMGWTEHDHASYKTFERDGNHIFESVLQYDTKWDWLKPVVDEIYTYALAHPDEVKKIRDISIVVEIGACWDKVVSFIKWYNQNRKK